MIGAGMGNPKSSGYRAGSHRLGGGTSERGRAHIKARRCPWAWPVQAGLGGGLLWGCYGESTWAELCFRALCGPWQMLFFEKVKIGESGEINRSKYGEELGETNRVWSW